MMMMMMMMMMMIRAMSGSIPTAHGAAGTVRNRASLHGQPEGGHIVG